MPNILTNEPLFEEISHFIKVIRGEEANRSSGEYGSEVVKSLQAADQSLLAGGKFVKIKR
jgi:hypothetical protein